MPTEISVKVINLRTGDNFTLKRTINRELPKKGRWIAYQPNLKRKSKAKQRK